MRTLLIIALSLFTIRGFAYEPIPDTAINLSEVVISARRLEHFSTGLHVRSFQQEQYEDFPGILLSEILTARSTHFIKTYGAGGLASISMRGTAAQHTAVYWNGFNINPPNIDMADISMLPLYLFSRVDIASGGNSALFGNGSIGGSIHLSSQQASQKKHLRIATSVGQHNNRLIALSSGYGLGKLHLSSSAWFNSSENDFTYVNTTHFNQPKERLSNADASHAGFLQEAQLPISARQKLMAGFWFQDREAGIPPSMTMNKSHARQHDRMIRTYLQWNLERDRLNYSVKSGYTSDFLHYSDTLIGLDSKIRVGVWTTEAELSAQLTNDTQFTIGANYQQHHARVDAYVDDANPGQLSLFLMVRHHFPELDWLISAGARKEFHSDFQGIPAALSLGWKGRLSEQFYARLNFAGNYRTPTLNDRYWQPGGNSDLKPETSINTEAGLDFNFFKEGFNTNISAGVFNNRIRNWITWLPSAQAYWKPENVTDVSILGFETNLDFKWKWQKWNQRLELAYSATRSLYGSGSNNSDNKRPQLIYTPVHVASAAYTARIENWTLHYTHQFTGSRFTDRANTNKLPAFHTADLSLVRTIKIKHSSLSLSASIKNLTNHAYQVIEYRPMPGRTFSITIIFNLLDHSEPKP
jgi:vitamin B12 transporter